MSSLYLEQVGHGQAGVRVRVEDYDLGHVKIQAGIGTYVCIDLPVLHARELARHLVAAADAADRRVAAIVGRAA